MIEYSIFIVFIIIWIIIVLLATFVHLIQLSLSKTIDNNGLLNKITIIFSLISNYRKHIRVNDNKNVNKSKLKDKSNILDGIRVLVHLMALLSHFIAFFCLYLDHNIKYFTYYIDFRGWYVVIRVLFNLTI